MERKDRIVQEFMSHRLVTEELIQKIDEKHLDYKPTETSMPAKELVTHMLQSFYTFASAAKEGTESLLKRSPKKQGQA